MLRWAASTRVAQIDFFVIVIGSGANVAGLARIKLP